MWQCNRNIHLGFMRLGTHSTPSYLAKFRQKSRQTTLHGLFAPFLIIETRVTLDDIPRISSFLETGIVHLSTTIERPLQRLLLFARWIQAKFKTLDHHEAYNPFPVPFVNLARPNDPTPRPCFHALRQIATSGVAVFSPRYGWFDAHILSYPYSYYGKFTIQSQANTAVVLCGGRLISPCMNAGVLRRS